jgi:UDP-glucuronate 4-epimerase
VDTPFKYEIFNLGEHHTTSLRALIDLISAALDKPADIRQLELQPGDVEITYADIDKARRLLGYDPQIGMEEGIRRFVAWYKAQ